MKHKLLAALTAAALTAGPAMAELKIVDTSYRTGPYAANGIPFSDGYQDYFTLLNERDGGIGGEMINLVECETGYNTEKGVECYEANKGGGALVSYLSSFPKKKVAQSSDRKRVNRSMSHSRTIHTDM